MMQQALNIFQQSVDANGEDNFISQCVLDDNNIAYVSMLVTISQMLRDNGDFKEAIEYLEDALQKVSQSLYPWNSLPQTSSQHHIGRQSSCYTLQHVVPVVLQVQSSQANEYCTCNDEEG